MPELMTPDHTRWSEFQHRLVFAVLCAYDPDDENSEFRCNSDYAHTERILAAMGFDAVDIAATLKHWATETLRLLGLA